MKRWTLLILFLLGLLVGCASSPTPAPKKQEPAADPNASQKTLNETQNMKDLYKEKVDESAEKKKK